jgi:hypothetical protein
VDTPAARASLPGTPRRQRRRSSLLGQPADYAGSGSPGGGQPATSTSASAAAFESSNGGTLGVCDSWQRLEASAASPSRKPPGESAAELAEYLRVQRGGAGGRRRCGLRLRPLLPLLPLLTGRDSVYTTWSLEELYQ